jgi:hypothetical protein
MRCMLARPRVGGVWNREWSQVCGAHDLADAAEEREGSARPRLGEGDSRPGAYLLDRLQGNAASGGAIMAVLSVSRTTIPAMAEFTDEHRAILDSERSGASTPAPTKLRRD